MRILIDAMGGDNAPEAIVQGALLASKEYDAELVLIGKEEKINAVLRAEGAEPGGKISVVNAEDEITMEDDPATAVRRKKDSSMAVMLTMLAHGEGDAAISGGSTGALLSGATLTVRRIPGVRRACFAPVIPNGKKGVVLTDCGANSECTPEYLLQFAHLGNIYAREVLGIERPRVALLNIGSEESKGGELQKATYALLQAEDEAGRLHFVGNVESSQVYFDAADVIVSDGFSGNVALKAIEGTAKFLLSKLKESFTKNTKNKLAALMVKGDVAELKNMLDVSEVGGTPLLGLRKSVIKVHGSTDARGVVSTVRQAIHCVENDVVGAVERSVAEMKTEKASLV